MGTRADFYIGRGEEAKWLGSIAWDGYPEGNPKQLLTQSLTCDLHEEEYIALVMEMIRPVDDRSPGTLPYQGWPWPWNSSHLTDYAYALEGGSVWVSVFNGPWWRWEGEEQRPSGEADPAHPDMSSIKKVAGGARSGLIQVFG